VAAPNLASTASKKPSQGFALRALEPDGQVIESSPVRRKTAARLQCRGDPCNHPLPGSGTKHIKPACIRRVETRSVERHGFCTSASSVVTLRRPSERTWERKRDERSNRKRNVSARADDVC